MNIRSPFVIVIYLGVVFQILFGSVNLAHSQSTVKHHYKIKSEPSPDIGLTAKEKQFLKQHPIIRLGVNPVYAPYEFRGEDGKYKGISQDYVGLISNKLNINFEIIPIQTWTEILKGTENKSVDILSAISDTEKGSVTLNFSKPYVSYPHVIITQHNHTSVSGLKGFKDKRFVLVKGDSRSAVIKGKHPSMKIIEVKSHLEALRTVAIGKADAMSGDLAVLGYLIQRHAFTTLKIASPAVLPVNQHHFAVRKDWPELISAVQKALNAVTEKEHNQISRN